MVATGTGHPAERVLPFPRKLDDLFLGVSRMDERWVEREGLDEEPEEAGEEALDPGCLYWLISRCIEVHRGA